MLEQNLSERIKQFKKILIVDDSVASGNALTKSKALLHSIDPHLSLHVVTSIQIFYGMMSAVSSVVPSGDGFVSLAFSGMGGKSARSRSPK